MKNIYTTLLLLACFICIGANNDNFISCSKVEVSENAYDECRIFVEDQRLYEERWDTLAQPIFWRTVMNLTTDSGVINIGSTRQMIEKVHVASWDRFTPEQKQAYRDSIKEYYCLPEDEHVYMTTGKSHFYHFNNVLPAIDRGIRVFERESTDPFYAQAILLIESPGTPKKSPVGAYGSFQLMKSVAKSMGLTVNEVMDERKDFDKSAWAAAKLIRTVCIPETNNILNNRGIAFHANDIWYKLLVLHVYHAGAYNVGKAVDCVPLDKRNGNELIHALWQVECGSFKNASQNYSQVALASLMELEKAVYSNCEYLEPLVLIQE